MKLSSILAAIAAMATPAAVAGRPMTVQREAAIDAAVRSGMARTRTQGMAIAVIEDGRVVFEHAYGLRDRSGAPLRTDTVM